jgi:hypothetical protein
MPEPAKKKQRFEAQVQSALPGVRIVPQAGRAESSKAGMADSSRAQAGALPAEANLVEKLIDFFKTME